MDGTQEGLQLIQRLNTAFAQRYQVILDRFNNTEDKNASKFVSTLTLCERKRKQALIHVIALISNAVYAAGQLSCLHHSQWKKRRMETIEHSHIISMAKRFILPNYVHLASLGGESLFLRFFRSPGVTEPGSPDSAREPGAGQAPSSEPGPCRVTVPSSLARFPKFR
eukprot:753511-Hanusia_phi.AAC.4